MYIVLYMVRYEKCNQLEIAEFGLRITIEYYHCYRLHRLLLSKKLTYTGELMNQAILKHETMQ